jgi:hypothetical protein
MRTNAGFWIEPVAGTAQPVQGAVGSLAQWITAVVLAVADIEID